MGMKLGLSYVFVAHDSLFWRHVSARIIVSVPRQRSNGGSSPGGRRLYHKPIHHNPTRQGR